MLFSKLPVYGSKVKRLKITSQSRIDSTIITSLVPANTNVINNTGQHFMNIVFISLALHTIAANKYKHLTLKSTIFSLWEMLAAYNYIF